MRSENSRIIVNTGILFSKLIICVFLGLFQTRFVLNALGSSDFGIFSLVGSCVAMLSFLNSAMSMSAQRFISYSIGEKDSQKTKVVYASAKKLLHRIAFFVLVLLEIVMIFFFESVFSVPDTRAFAAKVVFQCVAISSFFTIISVPLDATLNACENMLSIAVFSFLDVSLRFVCAIMLFYIPGDSLIIWSAMLISVAFLLFALKWIYCHKRYGEIVASREPASSKILREIFSFTLYNAFSSLSGIAKHSGIAVVLGMFFTTTVNAAYGIANQVNGQVMNFSHMLLKAVTPQIVKSESSNNHQRSLKLSVSSCKFSFLLISFFAFPLILNMPFILKIWLKQVPEWTILFCQLILLLSMVGQMTLPLFYFVQAIGNIKLYQLSLGFLQLFNLPVVYVLCYCNFSPAAAMVSTIVIEGLAGILRVFYAKKYGNMSASKFVFRNIIPSMVLVFMAVGLMYLSNPEHQIEYFLGSSVVVEIVLVLSAWFILLDSSEKTILKEFVSSLKSKVLCKIKRKA